MPVIAVSAATWRAGAEQVPAQSAGGNRCAQVEVEAWTYPPAAGADGPAVDRLSLFLSLRGSTDERVEAALHEAPCGNEMVRGLERFRDAFAAHVHQYTLIGGTACDLLLEQVDLPFRATKDLDIASCPGLSFTPIPIDGLVSSLSAILLDEAY